MTNMKIYYRVLKKFYKQKHGKEVYVVRLTAFEPFDLLDKQATAFAMKRVNRHKFEYLCKGQVHVPDGQMGYFYRDFYFTKKKH